MSVISDPQSVANWQIVGPAATAAGAINRGTREPNPVDSSSYIWAGTEGVVVEISFGPLATKLAESTAWFYANTGSTTNLIAEVLNTGEVIAQQTLPAGSVFAWRSITFTVPVGSQGPLVLRFTATGGYDSNVRAAYLDLNPATQVGDPRVRVVGVTDKILPNTTLEPATYTATSATLVAGLNEYASFQIVVSAAAQRINAFALAVGALADPAGKTISAAAVRPYRVTYYETTVATSADAGGHVGLWPDPLIPVADPISGDATNAFPVAVPKGENRAAWIDILIPKETVPGTYSGDFAVTLDGTNVTVPVSVEVLGFSLPATSSLSSGFVGNLQNVADFLFPGWTTEQRYQAQQLVVRLGLNNRISIVTQWRLTNGGGQTVFERLILPLVRGGDPVVLLPGAKLTAVFTVHESANNEFLAWKREAETYGFQPRAVVYDPIPCDEIAGQGKSWPVCRDQVKDVEAKWPQAAVLLTADLNDIDSWETKNPNPPGPITVVNKDSNGRLLLVTIINSMDPPAGSQRPPYTHGFLDQSASNRLWLYTSNNSWTGGVGWAGYQIDANGAHARAMGWLCFTQQVSGEHYYDCAALLTQAWKAGGLYQNGGNGDGTLFYPASPGQQLLDGTTYEGPKTLLESIRLKLICQGRQDFEYLNFLARSNPATATQVMQIAKSVFANGQSASSVTDEQIMRARASLVDHLRPLLPVTIPEQGLTL